jgi:mRNA interferase MazF
MTAFRRGDVVLVAFPFTDLTTTKTRPALVISSDSFHRAGLDVILAGITSKISKDIPITDFLLSPEDQTSAGLPKPSLVRLGKIVTLDCRLVRKKLGHISGSTLDRLTLALHHLLSSEPLNQTQPVIQEVPSVYRAVKSKGKSKKRQ